MASDAFVLWDIYFGRPSVSESNSQDNYTRLPQGVSAWEEQLLPAWECHSVCGAGDLPGMRVPPSAPLKVDIVVHTRYPGPRAEAGESGISGHLWLHRELTTLPRDPAPNFFFNLKNKLTCASEG